MCVNPIKKCPTCLHLYTSTSQEHVKHCGLQYCPNCSKEVIILQHKCFLQSTDDDYDKKNTIFVYFDIEARQDTGNHIANLLCAETDQNNQQFTFKGEQCVESFLQWVHTLANDETVDKVIVVAHNFKGYDGYLILEELYKQHTGNSQQIFNGAKILSLELPNIKFIDSMNFFPMALANFPKTFGLNELKKGFFPHFFNTQEHQIYEEETRTKVERLSQLGYHVKEMWECEWNRKIQTEPRINEFIEWLDIVTPLNPREAFFGGRTNAIKLYHKVKDGEQINYSDMISLYPCANLECDYPVGHPQLIDQPGTTDVSRYYGLVKCNILPPYELYHPVLPYRIESKLVFPLCRTCVQEQLKQHLTQRSEKCPHSP
ncbi:unnamed protein product [Pocillopora meandrina]|uniref:DNA-directed DNA polymerase n=1 Tax=Pocillopora meandrina TaxID=46732 RepID=A0AAU9Y3D2_9CNID|nr:unnamed protein product [Pocillopora meandrina]